MNLVNIINIKKKKSYNKNHNLINLVIILINLFKSCLIITHHDDSLYWYIGDERDHDAAPRQELHAEKAAKRTKRRKLAKYIRLADYLIINTLMTLAFERTVKFADILDVPFPEIPEIVTVVVEEKEDDFAAFNTEFNDNEIRKAIPKFSVEVVLHKTAKPIEEVKDPKGPAAVDKKGKKQVPANQVVHDDTHVDATELGDLVFKPTEEEFQNSLSRSIDLVIKKLTHPVRLTKDQEFAEYTKRDVNEETEDRTGEVNVEHMVLTHEKLINEKTRIREGVSRAFEAAQIAITRFERFKVLYLENIATDIQSYRDASPELLAEMLDKFALQIKEFELFESEMTVGILMVDSHTLKDQFSPEPIRLMEEIRKMLPIVAREKADAILNE